MIYFIQPVDGGPVKIGTTENLEARLTSLESHYGRPLALLASLPGGREEERAIHARFGHLRFGRTEQFRPSPELMTFIGRPLLVVANPEAVEAIAPKKETPMIAVRCTTAFKDWLNELADHARATPSQLLEWGLVELARQRGFEAPPKR